VYQISITTTQPSADIISSILWDCGAIGVSLHEPLDIGDVDFDYIDESLLQISPNTIVSGFFESSDIQDIKKALDEFEKNCEWDVGSLDLHVAKVDNYQWVDEFKKYFVDVDYGSIVVVPEWSQNLYQKPTVKMQLSSSFGTGKHQTTSMCIGALQKFGTTKKSIADIGCGSGILGLTALSLGAEFVKFGDIDSQAIDATKYNLDLNSIKPNRYKVCQCSLLEGDSNKYDIIVANLTAKILIELGKTIRQNMHSDSIVITSGIILEKLEQVEQNFYSNDLKLLQSKTMDDWAMCVFELID
jgi:ribosomal protein L11 methyltransferase